MLNLYIVDLEEATIKRLEELFYGNPSLGIKVIGYSLTYEHAINDLGRARDADVFLISAYLPDTMGYELISPIKKINPNARIIIMLQTHTRNLATACREKGADDIIQKPFKAGILLNKILNKEAEEEEEADDSPLLDNQSSAPDWTPQAAAADPSDTRRALYDVYSENPLSANFYEEEEFNGDKPNTVCVFLSSGSSGKTTLLVNAAISIHKHSQFKPKICIIDFNLLFPSVLYKFHQDDMVFCKKNIYHLFEDIHNLNEELISEALITHEPTGIKILDTPVDAIRNTSMINRENIKQLITYLRSMFDLILIDTSTNFREDAASVPLTIADKGIIVLEPDLANLLNTRKLINMIKVIEDTMSEPLIRKFHIILNKENPKHHIHADTIKKTLHNTDIRLTIPDDVNVTQTSNNGQFIVDSSSQTARSIKELARMVYPFEEELFSLKKNKRSGMGFLRSLFNKK